MPLIPAWHVALLALLYAGEYFYRAWKLKEKRYMYLGKAAGRMLLAAVYLYIMFTPLAASSRAPLVRGSLMMFLSIDLFFVVQEHMLRQRNLRHDEA